MLLKSHVLYFLHAFLVLLYNESTFRVLFFCFSMTTFIASFLLGQSHSAWRTQH